MSRVRILENDPSSGETFGMPRLSNILPTWRIQRLRKLAPRIIELVSKEMRSPLRRSVSFRDRLDLWKSGFLSESALMYDFDKYPRSDYLSDYTRFTKDRINGVYTILLSNKIIFDAVMRAFPEKAPTVYGMNIAKTFQPISQDPQLRSMGEMVAWCADGHNIVAKPIAGGGGGGIIVIQSQSGELLRNGAPTSLDKLANEFKRLDGYLFQEMIQQAAYAHAIYPRATNSIRALTMWDFDVGEPFLAAAVHRFGSVKSSPVDNWTQGGVSAAVDLDSGTLSEAVAYPCNGSLEWHRKHPDTGQPIAGIEVPNWSLLREALLDLARALPMLRYVGWDFVLDQNANLKIIEGNHRSDVNLIQVHGPLLADHRIREFFGAN